MKFFSILIVFILLSCNSENRITKKQIENIKKEYTKEVINYFYETVFHVDGNTQKENNIKRWNEDIYIIILGKPSAEELRLTNEVISKINNLKLPIKIQKTKNIVGANIKIYFGSDKFIQDTVFKKKDNALGKVEIESWFGKITSATIGIINKSKDGYPKQIRSMILEELVQSLGIIGDSYSYPNSLFYEGTNFNKKITALDKELLLLLYDLPINYSRTCFEEDFKDELYSKKNIEKYIKKNKISKKSLVNVKKCFIDGVLVKWAKNTSVYINGDYSKNDSLNIIKGINAINKISPNIQLELKPNTNITIPNRGIFFIFKQNDSQDPTIISTNSVFIGTVSMFSKQIQNEIKICYKNKFDSELKKEKCIIKNLYISLVGGDIDISTLYYEKDNIIHFDKEYIERLKLVYENDFVDGYTISEFEDLIKKLYSKT
jgi:hypothetical protein